MPEEYLQQTKKIHWNQSRKQEGGRNKKNIRLKLKIPSIFITLLYFKKNTLETSSSWSVTAHLFPEKVSEQFPFLSEMGIFWRLQIPSLSLKRVCALRKRLYKRPQVGSNWQDFTFNGVCSLILQWLFLFLVYYQDLQVKDLVHRKIWLATSFP